MAKVDDLDFYELWGMKYKGVQYTHDSAEPVSKVLKNLAKIVKAKGLDNAVVQSITTTSNYDDEDLFDTTIIVSVQ